jgi:hypothetical protein
MVQQNPNNQHWAFRDDYLECINSRAITQNIRKQLHRSIIIHVIEAKLIDIGRKYLWNVLCKVSSKQNDR